MPVSTSNSVTAATRLATKQAHKQMSSSEMLYKCAYSMCQWLKPTWANGGHPLICAPIAGIGVKLHSYIWQACFAHTLMTNMNVHKIRVAILRSARSSRASKQ